MSNSKLKCSFETGSQICGQVLVPKTENLRTTYNLCDKRRHQLRWICWFSLGKTWRNINHRGIFVYVSTSALRIGAKLLFWSSLSHFKKVLYFLGSLYWTWIVGCWDIAYVLLPYDIFQPTFQHVLSTVPGTTILSSPTVAGMSACVHFVYICIICNWDGLDERIAKWGFVGPITYIRDTHSHGIILNLIEKMVSVAFLDDGGIIEVVHTILMINEESLQHGMIK